MFKRLPSKKTLEEKYDKFNKEYFNNQLPYDTKIEWSTKMTKSAGLCIPRKKIIRISWHYARRFPEDVENTLIHEMIHLKFPNHGPQFYAEVDRINAYGKMKVSRFSLGRAAEPKYYYICTKCGIQFGRDKRVNIARYVCQCNGKLELLPENKKVAEEER